jgi:hypothetical protein
MGWQALQVTYFKDPLPRRAPHNPKVVGSNPTPATNSNYLIYMALEQPRVRGLRTLHAIGDGAPLALSVPAAIAGDLRALIWMNFALAVPEKSAALTQSGLFPFGIRL